MSDFRSLLHQLLMMDFYSYFQLHHLTVTHLLEHSLLTYDIINFCFVADYLNYFAFSQSLLRPSLPQLCFVNFIEFRSCWWYWANPCWQTTVLNIYTYICIYKAYWRCSSPPQSALLGTPGCLLQPPLITLLPSPLCHPPLSPSVDLMSFCPPHHRCSFFFPCFYPFAPVTPQLFLLLK